MNSFYKLISSSTSYFDNQNNVLKAYYIDTYLGLMVAVADEKVLYILEFFDKKCLEYEIKKLCVKIKSGITVGKTVPIISIEKELELYFKGRLRVFKTSVYFLGTSFQKIVWNNLKDIPYGETRSYLDQAKVMNKTSACRAVANANGANQLAIVIPCHRVIRRDGNLGGYSAGIQRKQWLIEHENSQRISSN
ncbi:methylated-DNA--[protein]-cysteine S-methyltransferase (plasmid) [Candidatus Bandiella numerosa]|uniref:methylated-DNA--[protein]-cysteine S-methyltransferase n=1 Tax=Candidatus Bandiella numerosa TaxID=2570586 RepID=UPI00249DBF40|nr:methylated-DNA--[protein]-cysteine S-methyltransferase [Candidatus Bandiella numerosa]WHA05737.1 methylated-DNA--[protein]-cysteine S-methyltransferase [Candidatus Bandiella numerosa]